MTEMRFVCRLFARRGDRRPFLRASVCGDGGRFTGWALVDSGSTESAISPRAAKQCHATVVGNSTYYSVESKKPHRTKDLAVWICAPGVSCAMFFAYTLDVPTEIRRHRFDILLGARWLRENGLVVDVRGHRLLRAE